MGNGTFPIRGYEIAALLGLSPGGRLSRRQVADILWPSSSPTQSYGNLRYVLHALRQWSDLNRFPLFDASPTDIMKRSGISDLDDFLSADPPTTVGGLKVFVSRFSGELLQGHASNSSDFDDWLTIEREGLRRRFVDAVLLSVRTIVAPEVEDVLATTQAMSPFDERTVLARVRNLVAQGRRAAAVSIFEQFKDQYWTELGIGVSAQTRQMIGFLVPEALARPEMGKVFAAADHEVKTRTVMNVGLPTVLILPPLTTTYQRPQSLFLGRALVSEVTIALGRMRIFAMFAPHTAKRLDHDDPVVAARTIGASYVVSTSLLDGRSGSSLGFSLIHTASQEILVADRVPLLASGSGDIDERLATAIATTVSAHVSSVELSRFKRTGEASAFAHYLLGQERLRYDLQSIRKARSHFKRAATLSPRFAPAHAMIARSLTYEWLVLGRPEPDLLREAFRLGSHAAELDPLLASGPWEIGHALMYLQRLDDSLEHIDAALDRSPHVADLLADRADVLIHLNDGKLAKKTILRAMFDCRTRSRSLIRAISGRF